MSRRRRRSFKFTERKQSLEGMLASGAGALLLLLYGVFVNLAYHSESGLSTYYGSAGLLLALCSIVATGFAIHSLSDEDAYRLFPRLAFALCLIANICWIGTYVLGFFV